MDDAVLFILAVALVGSLILGFAWMIGMVQNWDMYAYVDGVTQSQLNQLCENDDLFYLDMELNKTSCPKCSLVCYPEATLLHFQIRHQSLWQNRTRITTLYLEQRGFTVYEAWQSDW
jgi:hypothetical protein